MMIIYLGDHDEHDSHDDQGESPRGPRDHFKDLLKTSKSSKATNIVGLTGSHSRLHGSCVHLGGEEKILHGTRLLHDLVIKQHSFSTRLFHDCTRLFHDHDWHGFLRTSLDWNLDVGDRNLDPQ